MRVRFNLFKMVPKIVRSKWKIYSKLGLKVVEWRERERAKQYFDWKVLTLIHFLDHKGHFHIAYSPKLFLLSRQLSGSISEMKKLKTPFNHLSEYFLLRTFLRVIATWSFSKRTFNFRTRASFLWSTKMFDYFCSSSETAYHLKIF